MPNDHSKWQQTYLNTFHAAYRKHKKKREWTNLYIAEEVGVDQSTAENWSKGEASAQGGNLFALMDLFGAEFANEMLAPVAMTGVYQTNIKHVTVSELHSIISKANHIITTAREDGDVDPQEDAKIKNELGDLVHHSVDYMTNGNGRKT